MEVNVSRARWHDQHVDWVYFKIPQCNFNALTSTSCQLIMLFVQETLTPNIFLTTSSSFSGFFFFSKFVHYFNKSLQLIVSVYTAHDDSYHFVIFCRHWTQKSFGRRVSKSSRVWYRQHERGARRKFTSLTITTARKE